ncbi:hypothetical protein Q0Z83_006000 [Actinoplanes sichuanensis]|nr:hypothetical protein Q0Z83_006000 [Actinoplanes sichuanensis]
MATHGATGTTEHLITRTRATSSATRTTEHHTTRTRATSSATRTTEHHTTRSRVLHGDLRLDPGHRSSPMANRELHGDLGHGPRRGSPCRTFERDDGGFRAACGPWLG